MEKQMVVHQCYGILLYNEKEWSSNTHKPRWNSETLGLVNEIECKETVYCMISFIWNSRKVKTIMTRIRSLHAWASGLGNKWLASKWHPKNFQGNGTVLYLGYGRDFMTLCSYQNSSNCSFEWVSEFYCM